MKKLLLRLRYCGQLLYNFIFTNRTRMLTIRIIILSAWFRMLIKFVPMPKLQTIFGEMGRESADTESSEAQHVARMIGRRVERVCNKTPWNSKCLVQALVAQRILCGKGIHTTLYLGLRKENNELHAHAWLRSGSCYITGGIGDKDHTVVSCFYK